MVKKMEKEAQITFRIDAKLKSQLEAEAAAQGLSPSAYIRRLLMGLQQRPPSKK